jgi:uncharacterized metal-binding protein (TIGR02443 family)
MTSSKPASSKVRFIAGARCSACGQLDVVRMRFASDGSQDSIDCVACGHTDTRPTEVNVAIAEQKPVQSVVKLISIR